MPLNARSDFFSELKPHFLSCAARAKQHTHTHVSMETTVRTVERYALLVLHEGSATAAAWTATLDSAVARLAPWLVPQQRHYLVGGIAVFTALVGAISTLFVWIASRQVRPRKLPPPSTRAELPTSPMSKRKRHSRSFTDLEALERDRIEENAILDRQDRFVFPRTLRQKCRPEDLKLIYDMLSKVRATTLDCVVWYLIVSIGILCRHRDGQTDCFFAPRCALL